MIHIHSDGFSHHVTFTDDAAKRVLAKLTDQEYCKALLDKHTLEVTQEGLGAGCALVLLLQTLGKQHYEPLQMELPL